MKLGVISNRVSICGKSRKREKRIKKKKKKVGREDPVFPYQQENNILKIFQDLDQRPYHVEYTRSHQLTLSYDEPHQYMEG